MRIPHITPKDATGLIDKVVGLGKEIAGTTLGDQRLISAGEAQQTKGGEKLKAIRAQADADVHRAKARVSEAKQKAVENAPA